MSRACAISSDSSSLEACHILRPSLLEEERIMRLECAWGYKYGTLKTDVEGNTMYLTPQFCRMFDADLWALLPLDCSLLESIFDDDYTIDKPIETAYDGQSVFKYVFVPLPGFDTSFIIRRLDAAGTSFEEHRFPYTSMPILHLQVQPQYVVFDLYRKIIKHEGNVTTSIRKEEGYRPYFLQYYEADSVCRGLYRMWITWNVPPTFTESDYSTNEGIESPPQLRPGAHSWPVDEVGLRPTDSTTYIPGAANDNDDDDDDDDLVADETDSAFKARLTHWVTTLPPGLAPDSQLTPLADTSRFMDDELSQSDAESPTMVGSVSSDISMKASRKNRPASPPPLDSSLVSA